jgi:hypothetical protein
MPKRPSRRSLPLASLAAALGCPPTSLPDDPAGTLPATGGQISFPVDPDPTTGTTTPTTTATTTDATDTGASESSDTGSSTAADLPGSYCGDGDLDPGEACDHGDANSNSGHCTNACVFNVCGDGLLLVGWELCDEGSANSDLYGSICTLACTPAPRCGDHVVQPEFAEECDLGPGVEDEQGIACDMCRMEARRAFVTSATFTGDLGGIWNADARCKELAAAVGDPRAANYHAFLSTGAVSAAERFAALEQEPWPYITFTGKKLADSLDPLIADGPAGEGISITETGELLLDALVLTATAPGGTTFEDLHCADWTSASKLAGARTGHTFPSDPTKVPTWKAEGWWTSYASIPCDKTYFHLYCLEL